MSSPLAVVRGGGDLATGTINRLHNSGFEVIVLEIEKPTVIRLEVSAATAVYENDFVVEGVMYKRANTLSQARDVLSNGNVPVLIDPDMKTVSEIKPNVFIDATLAKRNMGVTLSLAPCVIGLGPGFTADKDCHAVIETTRGHDLGRIIYSGSAKKNTGIPGMIAGHAEERVIRAPQNGYIRRLLGIGDHVKADEVIGYVDKSEVKANIDGVIRGLIHESVYITEGMKIGDVDPRDNKEACFSISDKARALGGSVLEAYLKLSGGIKIN